MYHSNANFRQSNFCRREMGQEMSACHKVYIIDFKNFPQELAPLITAALRAEELKELRGYPS